MKKIKKSEFVESKDTVNVSPGEMLASLRELQGLSQNDLARLTGIAQANISSMEKGRQTIGADRAVILAKALHVHPAVILFPNYEVDFKTDKAA
jgi:transcriptional regulator with XRE-family HTH domain